METSEIHEVEGLVPGGLYKVKRGTWDEWGNDQSQRTAIVCLGDDGYYYMWDTHAIKSNYGKFYQDPIAAVIKLAEVPHTFAQYNAEQYYQNKMKLTSPEDIKHHFELLCDLHDFHIADRFDNVNEYNREDVVGPVQLYWEHAFNWHGRSGVMLLRNDAQPNTLLKFKEAFRKYKKEFDLPKFPYKSTKENLESHIKYCDELGVDIDPRDMKEYYYYQDLTLLIKQFNISLERLKRKHVYKYTFAFEDSDICLGDIKGVAHHLAHDAYCPNEIYGVNGLGYRLYPPTTPVKVVLTNLIGDVVVVGRSGNSAPEFLVIAKDLENSGRVSAITSIDITSKNFELLKSWIKWRQDNSIEKPEEKFDSYSEEQFDKHIDDFINSLESKGIPTRFKELDDWRSEYESNQ